MRKSDGSRVLYLAVTADRYELPIYVADTALELADVLGLSHKSVHSTFSKYASGELSGELSGRRLMRVRIEEEDDDELVQ